MSALYFSKRINAIAKTVWIPYVTLTFVNYLTNSEKYDLQQNIRTVEPNSYHESVASYVMKKNAT